MYFVRIGTELFSSVHLLSHVRLSVTPWTAACQASLSIIKSWSILTLMSIELVMPSNHLTLCRPLLLLPSIFLSIRVFSNESVLHIRWPKFWSFSFSINPSNEYSGLISFRMDLLTLLAVQGTLKIFPNTKWADYLKRNQVQHFQGRLSGPNDYLKMRNKGVDSQVWFQDPILEEKIFVWPNIGQIFEAPNIGDSASTSVLPMNTQDWPPLGWTSWISLQSKELSRVFSKHHSSKASIFWHSTFFIVQLVH